MEEAVNEIPKPLRILALGLSEKAVQHLNTLGPSVQIDVPQSSQDGMQMVRTSTIRNWDMVACGPGIHQLETLGMLNACRKTGVTVPVVFIYDGGGPEVEMNRVNGFGNVFVLPKDKEILETQIEVVKNRKISGTPNDLLLTPLSVRGLRAGPVDHDVYIYIKFKKKYVRLVKKGGEITENHLARLRKHNVGHVYTD